MKSQSKIAALVLLAVVLPALAAVPLIAEDQYGAKIVYDNGNANLVNAWAIGDGFWVADSFTLSQPANVNAIVLIAYPLFPGDKPTTIDWKIYSIGPKNQLIVWKSESGTPLKLVGSNSYISVLEIDFQALALPASPAGRPYWLRLSNATSQQGYPIYWWESGGPSKAVYSEGADIPSEAFQVIDPPVAPGKDPASKTPAIPAVAVALTPPRGSPARH